MPTWTWEKGGMDSSVLRLTGQTRKRGRVVLFGAYRIKEGQYTTIDDLLFVEYFKTDRVRKHSWGEAISGTNGTAEGRAPPGGWSTRRATSQV